MNFRNCPTCGTVLVPDMLPNDVEAFKCPNCKETVLNICNGECKNCKELAHCGKCSWCVNSLLVRKYDDEYPTPPRQH